MSICDKGHIPAFLRLLPLAPGHDNCVGKIPLSSKQHSFYAKVGCLFVSGTFIAALTSQRAHSGGILMAAWLSRILTFWAQAAAYFTFLGAIGLPYPFSQCGCVYRRAGIVASRAPGINPLDTNHQKSSIFSIIPPCYIGAVVVSLRALTY
ncbi:hypothetical protein VXM60_08440 [Shewanella khirikhana]|uniref:hypothetical protein n=1 Tax=Shewanella khirikhana TaxID=1965282 RepID=UPI0030D2B764